MVAWTVVTSKVYVALSRVKYILNCQWIRDSYQAKRFLEETPYISKLATFEEQHNVPISQVLTKPDRHILFKVNIHHRQ